MWHLLYAKAGHELDIAEDLRTACFDVVCEPRIEFRRCGTDRRAKPVEVAYLPNYIFANVPVEDYFDVMAMDGLASTSQAVCEAEMRRVHAFQQEARREYDEAMRISKNQQAICEYKRGQAVRLLDGKFSDKAATFRKMVEREHDAFPKVVVETEMMGRVVTLEVDPLDVRAG